MQYELVFPDHGTARNLAGAEASAGGPPGTEKGYQSDLSLLKHGVI